MITKSMLQTALLVAGVAFVGALVEQVAANLNKNISTDEDDEDVVLEGVVEE